MAGWRLREPTASSWPRASAIARSSPRPSSFPWAEAADVWGQAGVAEEDRLDREEVGRVLRRSARRLRPYGRQVLAGFLLTLTWTATVLAGPYLVRFGIDRGIVEGDPSALNTAVVLYVLVAIAGYFVFRAQVM